MSFPKAKIRRFNDVQSDAPAPGTYNPIIHYKIKGYAPQKSKRFPDDKMVSKTKPTSINKAKLMPRKDPKPIIKSTTVTKGQKSQRTVGAGRTGGVTNHINILESEIKNLKDKVSTIMPSMNNKVIDLREIWQEKKQSLLIGDTEGGRLIDDNLNNILKEMSQLLNRSEQGRFQEIAFIQTMNS